MYFCNTVKRIYLSRKSCKQLQIIPDTFPYPIPDNYTFHTPETKHNVYGAHNTTTADSNTPRTSPPQQPKTLPYPPTAENIPKLEQYIIDKFSSSAFNKSPPFPKMQNVPPAHIHIKDDATPYARHVPIPIPIHWRDSVKSSLDDDVQHGIIEPVPIGEAIEWCSQMVVVGKKDGRVRRTVDFQKLNQQCKRETNHCQPPFMLATQVPPNVRKTVFDAVDGYHAIELDEASKSLTTFITPWGAYRYRRLPQGYLASGDAYTRRYDEIISHIPRKIKCVDDVLMWDNDIESSFFRTWEFLTLCANQGIVVSKNKFKFCRDDVEFAGLRLTNTGIAPSPKILSAISDFPTPTNLTDARSWFGLVNQVAWAHATSEIMAPFRDLIKPKTKFYWDTTLERIFQDSKKLLIKLIHDGVESYDINKPTCLQTDWSQRGMGYLLLQQHCKCNINSAPTCCKGGWKLVYAGSCFTSEAEARYSPTEGEAAAIVWSLKKSRFFTLGCPNLIVCTDHRPLLGIFNDKELNNISTPRLFRLKEKTLMYNFKIIYNRGKWHQAADAVSRNPTSPVAANPDDDTVCYISTDSSLEHNSIMEDDLEILPHCIIAAINHHTGDENPAQTVTTPGTSIRHGKLKTACSLDTTYQELIKTIHDGFPSTRQLLHPSLRAFWEVRHRLSIINNTIVLMDTRLVIPSNYQKNVLTTLHSAHQGVASMKHRANETVYWPGINNDLRNQRYNCS